MNPTDTLLDGEIVKRPNTTIGISPKQGGNLTLLVRRLFNVLVHFSVKDGDRETYRRPLREVMRYIDYNSNDTSRLKGHLEAMAAMPIMWETSTDDDEIWTVSTLIAHASIIKPKSKGIPSNVEWSFSAPIRAKLLQPAQWTQLKLIMHTKLKTGASIGLFEICARYKGSPGGRTARRPYEWWVPAISGSRTAELPEYKYFKRDVLRPAIAEVNTHADFTIDLIEHKVGNRVAELQFLVQKKPATVVVDDEAPAYDGILLERVIRLGLSEMAARTVCEQHDSTTILTAVEYTEKRAAKSPPIDSKPAYFKAALKQGYKEPASAPKQEQRSLDITTPEAEREQLLSSFNARRRTEALRYWRELDAPDARAEIDAFLATGPAHMIAHAISKDLLSQKIAETAFTTWLSAKLWGPPTDRELLDFSLKTKKHAASVQAE